MRRVLNLLILCCVGLAVLAYLPGSGFLRKSDRAQITYVIEFEGVRPDFASYIREGDRVTSSEGCDLGTVAAGVEVGVYNVVRYDPPPRTSYRPSPGCRALQPVPVPGRSAAAGRRKGPRRVLR